MRQPVDSASLATNDGITSDGTPDAGTTTARSRVNDDQSGGSETPLRYSKLARSV